MAPSMNQCRHRWVRLVGCVSNPVALLGLILPPEVLRLLSGVRWKVVCFYLRVSCHPQSVRCRLSDICCHLNALCWQIKVFCCENMRTICPISQVSSRDPSLICYLQLFADTSVCTRWTSGWHTDEIQSSYI